MSPVSSLAAISVKLPLFPLVLAPLQCALFRSDSLTENCWVVGGEPALITSDDVPDMLVLVCSMCMFEDHDEITKGHQSAVKFVFIRCV